MTRRLRPSVADADERRREILERWRRPATTGVPDPDRSHVGDPDGPLLVPVGRRHDVTDDELVGGDGRWRDRPGMAAHLAFLRRERERLGILPGETEPRPSPPA